MTIDLADRYAKAEALLPHKLKKLILRGQVVPHWIGDTETFWYRNTTDTESGSEFYLVDAAKGTRKPAFDHERLADAVNAVAAITVDAKSLPFFSIDVRDNAIRVTLGLEQIVVSLDDYAATVVGPLRPGENTSPDGRWGVGLREHNLYLRDNETGAVRDLTTDGHAAYSYGTPPDSTASLVMQENLGFSMPPLVIWSPDSSRFVTSRLDQRDTKLMHLVRSSPLDGGRPKELTYRYAMTGDENVPMADLFVFNTADGEATQAKCEPILTEYVSALQLAQVWWNKAGDTVFWLSHERGGLTARLNALDPLSGEVTVLVEETGSTNLLHGPQFMDRNVRVLESGEIVWWSERTNWGHLYRYDPDGAVVALTSGEWLVRTLITVDELNRRVVFSGSAREHGRDIYLQGIYSVSLDGGEVTQIVTDRPDLDHDPRPSRSGAFFVDVMSKVDVPGISVLRNSNGEIVLELEEADASALYTAGWTPPERAVVTSADGKTDIYCSIYKPMDFDESKKYPVLDEIYPGPQVSTSPIRFPGSGGPMTAERNAPPFTALGFAVVTVDGRGTSMRERSFQDHSRLGGHGEFVFDHVAAIQELAKTRPWLDTERVGIYGHSGGGYASTHAMLKAPEFFKVAVSSAGDHDDSMYHAWWGERFFGMPDAFPHAEHANASHAHKLEGKLLLVHGDMDDNVTPHLTMRLVDALIKANKDFDLLIVPNADHSMIHNQAYWFRRRWDYFVQHLQYETPPDYRIADIQFDAEMLAAMMGV